MLSEKEYVENLVIKCPVCTNELVNVKIISKDGIEIDIACHPSMEEHIKNILKKYTARDMREYIKACNEMLKA